MLFDCLQINLFSVNFRSLSKSSLRCKNHITLRTEAAKEVWFALWNERSKAVTVSEASSVSSAGKLLSRALPPTAHVSRLFLTIYTKLVCFPF